MPTNKPPIRIGLLWHSLNSGNLGVGALTVGNIALAREAAAAAGLEPRFLVLGARDKHAASVTEPNVDVLPIDRRSLFTSRRYLNAMAGLDCVLDIGGGDSFADIYGPKRFAFLWTTKAIAIRRGVPLVLSPQTIGPFTRQPYKALASWAIRRSWLTVARDPLSYDFAAALAPGASRLLSADVAFRLPFDRRAAADDGKVHVGVNVSGLLWEQSRTGSNSFGLSVPYAGLMRRLLDTLAARNDVQVHLITHVVDRANLTDDDGKVADALARDYPDAIRVPDFATPSAAKSYISGLDFLVAARMHACIAAFSGGVPVVPVAYSRKFVGLFEGVLAYPHVLPTTGLDEDAALAFILDRLEQRKTLRDEIAAGNARVAPLLDAYVSALTSLFKSITARR